ncbi:MAG: uroporphyrinogen-III synthase, partial [Gammaproteobacteria bacterium]
MKKHAVVWVGRPRRRAAALARELRNLELTPLVKPAMRIAAAKDSAARKLFFARPQHFDLAVFVSEEAADRCRPHLPAAASLPALAVGPATFAAIAGIPALAAQPAPAGDSEALLRLPQLQAAKVRGKKIAVVGGVSGGDADSLSPHLCRILQKRGADISAVAVYRRLPPKPDAETARLVSAGIVRAAVAYSGGTAAAMLAMLAPNEAPLK